jgi:hypothetical protein
MGNGETAQPARATVIHYSGHMIAAPGQAGRFPAAAEARVAANIRSLLAEYNVGYGYGSLACGADILFVEALLARDAEVHVVLPFAKDSFVQESVAGGGANWPGRFEKCLERVSVRYATQGDYTGNAEVFAYTTRLAMDAAIGRARQIASEPVQIVVWDGEETRNTGGTFSDMKLWQGHGFKTVTIDSQSNR